MRKQGTLFSTPLPAARVKICTGLKDVGGLLWVGEEGVSVARPAPFTVKRASDCRAGGHVSVRTENEKFGSLETAGLGCGAHASPCHGVWGSSGCREPLLFLTTSLAENAAQMRVIYSWPCYN